VGFGPAQTGFFAGPIQLKNFFYFFSGLVTVVSRSPLDNWDITKTRRHHKASISTIFSRRNIMNQYYFAYGSNLNGTDWERWCERNNFPTGLLEPVGHSVYLPDYQLSFSHYSTSRSGGTLNVHPEIGSVVQGELFRVVDPRGWEALDRKEGAPHCYQRQTVQVLDTQQGCHAVQTYIKPIEGQRKHYEPTEEYLSIVLEGMRKFFIPSVNVRQLVDREKYGQPRPLDSLFVYGTLMRNEQRFFALGDQIYCALLAEAPGSLYDLGSYPGLVSPSGPDEWVQGDFIRIENIATILPQLDSIEGFRGFGERGSLFSRRLADVHVGDGRGRLAWVYVKEGTPEGRLIRKGCWRRHQNVRSHFLESLGMIHASGRTDIIDKIFAREWASMDDPRVDLPREITELGRALMRGRISERRLAQASGIWTAACF
jgi:gamma-glutamylcyclotransferase (GGCT)/AIG2-like uncharacterized protein YtfP